eukprot:2484373-Amphidinium_carterae.2
MATGRVDTHSARFYVLLHNVHNLLVGAYGRFLQSLKLSDGKSQAAGRGRRNMQQHVVITDAKDGSAEAPAGASMVGGDAGSDLLVTLDAEAEDPKIAAALNAKDRAQAWTWLSNSLGAELALLVVALIEST